MQKLMALAPPLSLMMPSAAPKPSADTWKIEWRVLKLQLPQFQHHYNGAGKLHSVGSLDEDAVFMAMVNGTAKKQFIKEVVHHRRQRQPKAPKTSSFIIQTAPDVSYLVICFDNPHRCVICRSESALRGTLRTVQSNSTLRI